MFKANRAPKIKKKVVLEQLSDTTNLAKQELANIGSKIKEESNNLFTLFAEGDRLIKGNISLANNSKEIKKAIANETKKLDGLKLKTAQEEKNLNSILAEQKKTNDENFKTLNKTQKETIDQQAIKIKDQYSQIKSLNEPIKNRTRVRDNLITEITNITNNFASQEVEAIKKLNWLNKDIANKSKLLKEINLDIALNRETLDLSKKNIQISNLTKKDIQLIINQMNNDVKTLTTRLDEKKAEDKTLDKKKLDLHNKELRIQEREKSVTKFYKEAGVKITL
ncbi:MAG: hypothetical protein U9R08_02915 [Nanoarchaeota archaeon]|nr:hypothetical protein [Nanoarchaeota archaeon]